MNPVRFPHLPGVARGQALRQPQALSMPCAPHPTAHPPRPRASAWSMVGALALALAPIGAQAQVRTEGLPLPEALKGVPAAGSQCARSPQEQQAARLAEALPAPDASCALAVQALGSAEAWTWVDARRPDQAEADARPGALRLPADAVHTKAFLRTRPVLLVGDGLHDEALLSQCRRLRQGGFSQVRVLQGGWPQWAWQQWLQAQAVPTVPAMAVGTAPAVPQRDAAQLWAASQEATHLVVGRRADGLVALLPFAASLDAWRVDAVRTLVDRRRKEVRAAPLLSLTLVYPADQATEVPLQSLRQALMPLPLAVHVVAGPSPASATLKQQLARLEHAWTARERGPRQPRCGQ